jgi:hypothetical protein
VADNKTDSEDNAVRDLLAKVHGALVGTGEDEEQNARITKLAIAVALSGSLILVLLLSLGGGEPPVRASRIDDPKALRPVDVKWDPGKENEGATSGGGGLSGGGGYGGRLLPKRCTGNEVQLKDAVRRTSGIHMIAGDANAQPCN